MYKNLSFKYLNFYKVDLLFWEGHLVYDCILDWYAEAILSRAHNSVYLPSHISFWVNMQTPNPDEYFYISLLRIANIEKLYLLHSNNLLSILNATVNGQL
jgi:hypothetical protein